MMNQRYPAQTASHSNTRMKNYYQVCKEMKVKEKFYYRSDK
jgi:hypothetical protein